MKILQDKTKRLAVLFNCEVSEDETILFAGVTIFRGGLSGEIDLFSEDGKKIRVKVPDHVIDNKTYVAQANKFCNLEIELIKGKSQR